jgi:hypothetical protein
VDRKDPDVKTWDVKVQAVVTGTLQVDAETREEAVEEAMDAVDMPGNVDWDTSNVDDPEILSMEEGS